MLQTRDLGFNYQGEQTLSFPDIDLRQGEDLLILGKSGVGKTTLLHLLGGLLRPNEGSISIAGMEINTLGDSLLDKFRGKQIGFIFQSAHFITSLTVEENLQLAIYLSGKDIKKERIGELLTELNIEHLRHKLPSRLSIGEQQRLSIARAIIHQPTVLLADEPTSSLDDENCQAAIELLIKETSKYDISLIVVTHDARLRSAFPKYIEL
jgi:putative ABC transport system ATP-binding protein